MNSYNQGEVQKLQNDLNQLGSLIKAIKWNTEAQIEQGTKISPCSLIGLSETLFLSHIIVFLSDSELLKLAEVCKSLNRLIFSPLSFRLISFQRQQQTKQIVALSLQKPSSGNQIQKKSNANQKPKQLPLSINIPAYTGPVLDASAVIALQERLNSIKFESEDDFEAQMITFRHTLSIISNALVHKLEENSSLQENINIINEDISSEKTGISKYLVKIKTLSDKANSLQNKLNQTKMNSERKQEQQKEEINHLKGQKAKLKNDNSSLRNENEELKRKIEQAQVQLEAAEKTKGLYKESIKKFKTLMVDIDF